MQRIKVLDRSIRISEIFKKLDKIPESFPFKVDEKRTDVYIAMSNNSYLVLGITAIEDDELLNQSKEELINSIHNVLEDNQGLIGVEDGFSKHGRHYSYSIVKTLLKDPQVMVYKLTMEIGKNNMYLKINGIFEERANIGLREGMLFKTLNMPLNWFKDPYDENYKRGVLMNMAEKEEYDSLFPDHPLSLLRVFIKEIIEFN